jgi:hypothetical protein
VTVTWGLKLQLPGKFRWLATVDFKQPDIGIQSGNVGARNQPAGYWQVHASLAFHIRNKIGRYHLWL